MVKADLVHRAMEAGNLQSPAAKAAVDALFESVASALARGDRVVLRRFAVFHTSNRRTGKYSRSLGIARLRADSPPRTNT